MWYIEGAEKEALIGFLICTRRFGVSSTGAAFF